MDFIRLTNISCITDTHHSITKIHANNLTDQRIDIISYKVMDYNRNKIIRIIFIVFELYFIKISCAILHTR